MATLAPESTAPADRFDMTRGDIYQEDRWQEPFRQLRA